MKKRTKLTLLAMTCVLFVGVAALIYTEPQSAILCILLGINCA